VEVFIPTLEQKVSNLFLFFESTRAVIVVCAIIISPFDTDFLLL